MKKFAPLPRLPLALLLVCLAWSPLSHAREGDGGKAAQIRVKGSDTLNKLLKEWARIYKNIQPHVVVEVTGGGSGNGIASLINGHTDIASSSRPLRTRELHLFTKKFNDIVPVGQVVALDAVSVVVHASNPLNGISLHTLMGIYGKGGKNPAWSDLNVQVPGCQDQKILPLSRKNNSGTYAFFRQTILKNQQEHFDPQMISMDGSDALISMVEQFPCAIGYSGMAFITSKVKTLCISQGQGHNAPCVPPTAASVLNKTYPLARSLYLYTLGSPQGEVKHFLEWIQGPEAREILLRTGYVPPLQG
ncbi:MAG: phosphate ABC transporter substrate-binding protein [Magnetococcales bacterium]|nr:phosphate ABC transporter substrate-binding protein [Magnetococcales bacterium]